MLLQINFYASGAASKKLVVKIHKTTGGFYIQNENEKYEFV